VEDEGDGAGLRGGVGARVGRASVLRAEAQELLSVILASPLDRLVNAGATVQVATAMSLVDEQRELLLGLRELGAQAEFLLDGSLVAVLQHGATATEQALLSAQAALLVQKYWPAAQTVVSMGRGVRSASMPVGEVLDRAARLLAGETTETLASGSFEVLTALRGEVLVDELTASLIRDRYELSSSEGGSGARGKVFRLHGPSAELDESKRLLGKPTPCVGRERELQQLESAFHATCEEPGARAVVVVGTAGTGKSRLRHEFLRRIKTQQPMLILSGRGLALSKGSAYGLIAQALRDLAGIGDSDVQSERWRRFQLRIGQHLPAEQMLQVVPLLALICQASPEDESARLVPAGLTDPQVLHEQIAQAFAEFLAAECRQGPVVLILEDLHWGDVPSVRLVDGALRQLAEQPLFVLCMARPEVSEQFPDLWAQRRRQYMPLSGLSRRACERLIREVLGSQISPEQEAKMIAQAAGNALFLEELIRVVADGDAGGAPETVLAMLQARLGRLHPKVRGLLCTASLFGSLFYRSGVHALVDAESGRALDAALAELCELEILQPHAESVLNGESAYAFRHDLVRDAAYALLSEADRELGHYLAARYLEAAGEREAVLLAEHYRRGGATAEATHWYRLAAEQALEASELGAAQKRAQTALDAGARGVERGLLLLLLANAAYWLRQYDQTRKAAEQALGLLTVGSSDYFHCAAQLLVSCGRLRDWEAVQTYLHTVLQGPVASDAVPALALCLSRTGYMFLMQGRLSQMKTIADRLALLDATQIQSQPVALAQVEHFRSAYCMVAGDVRGATVALEAAISAWEQGHDLRNALMERNTLACNYIEAGHFAEATRIVRRNLLQCQQAKIPGAHTLSLVILGYALTFDPAAQDEAHACLSEALSRSRQTGHRLHEGWALCALARLLFLQGRYSESEAQARLAAELTAKESPSFQAGPLSWLARSLGRQGRAREGLVQAEGALTILKNTGGFCFGPMVPSLARAELLLQLASEGGDVEAARQAVIAAKRRVLKLAERFSDPDWRACHLAHPENVATLALPELPAATTPATSFST